MLPGFIATHGICPICYELLMKHGNVHWPALLVEGDWRRWPIGGYWPLLARECSSGVCQTICHVTEPCVGWLLECDGLPMLRAGLDDVLEYANTSAARQYPLTPAVDSEWVSYKT